MTACYDPEERIPEETGDAKGFIFDNPDHMFT
jgi:hypothetical protein